MVGIDTISLDYGPTTTYPVHVILNGANIPFLENVAHLDKLAAELKTDSEGRATQTVEITALPMKIGNGSGGPTRVMAVVTTDEVEW